MPLTQKAINLFIAAKIADGPNKAANADGVATSQWEMEQNVSMQNWSFDKVDLQLQQIIKNIFVYASDTV